MGSWAGETDPDAGLIAAVRRDGDEASFRRLYGRHTPMLLAVLRRFAWGPGPGSAPQAADLEDLVQETWLRALRGLPGFAGRSRFSTWLTGIGVRCALETRRRQPPPRDRATEGRAGGAGGGDGEGSPPDAAAWTETAGSDGGGVARSTEARLDIVRCLHRLTVRERDVLLLHDAYGFTHEEIGRLLGIDAGTSKTHLHRARRAARGLLLAPRADVERNGAPGPLAAPEAPRGEPARPMRESLREGGTP